MSAICGIYAPRRPELASSRALESMLSAMDDRGETQQRFVDVAARVALGVRVATSFGAKAVDSWSEDDAAVLGVEGQGSASVLRPLLTADPASFPEAWTGIGNVCAFERAKKRLLIATDRLGSKPLYYYHDAARRLIVFASELRGVLAHPAVTAEIDEESLGLYLLRGATMPPFSIQRNAFKLGPGQVMSFDSIGALSKRVYSRVEPAEKALGDYASFLGQVPSHIEGAIERVTGGASRLAVYQSGGVDSSVALAALKRWGGADLTSFTLAYDGQDTDDLERAKVIAAEVGVRHVPVIVGSDELTPDVAKKLLLRFDEPADSTRAFTQYFLNEAARAEGLGSAVTGNESEGLWGGLSFWLKEVEERQRTPSKTLAPVGEVMHDWFTGDGLFENEEVTKMLGRSHNAVALSERHLESMLECLPLDNLFDAVHAMMFIRWPLSQLGFYAHVVSPMSGVEVRSVFRDMRLFEFARSIPNRYRGDDDNAFARKLLLDAYSDMCPSVRLPLRKLALPGVPLLNPTFPWLEPMLLHGMDRLKATGLIAPKRVDRLVTKYHERKSRPRAIVPVIDRLWQLLALQVWFEAYVLKTDPFGP